MILESNTARTVRKTGEYRIKIQRNDSRLSANAVQDEGEVMCRNTMRESDQYKN